MFGRPGIIGLTTYRFFRINHAWVGVPTYAIVATVALVVALGTWLAS